MINSILMESSDQCSGLDGPCAPYIVIPSPCSCDDSQMCCLLCPIQGDIKDCKQSPTRLSPLRQYSCILCCYSCETLDELFQHIESHAGPNEPYICQFCGKAWRNHICSHMPLRPFECGFCQGKYITNGELIRHKRYKHGGGKPHKCELCSYECVELAKLMRHQRMHAGVKPFKCPSCHYESYDKSKIRRHYVTHTREKPFECELCGSRFTQSGSLKTHLTNVHEINKVEFCCPYCNQLVTPNMGELRNHIKTSHHSTNYRMIVNKSSLQTIENESK